MSITALPTQTAAVALEGVTKTYGGGDGAVRALDDVSVLFAPSALARKTILALAGPRRAKRVIAI